MKPLHIVILVGAGVIGGIVLTNVLQRPPRTAPAPVVALGPAAPTPGTEPFNPSRPPARPARKEAAPRPRLAEAAASGESPQPVEIAQLPAVMAPPSPAAAPEAITPARPQPEPVAPASPPPPSPPNKVTLNAGTTILVRLIDGLSSERNNTGDAFTATLDQELAVEGFVIAGRGARVDGRVVTAVHGSKVSGGAALEVELTRIHTSDGQTVEVSTESFAKRGPQTQAKTATKVGGGAVLGAVIGGIAGGGKGAAIGAGVGGGAGAGAVALSPEQQATLPSETRITFRLRAPVTIDRKSTRLNSSHLGIS